MSESKAVLHGERLLQVAEVAALRNARLVTSTFALEWMPDPWRDVDAAGEWLIDLAIGHDLVHLNGYAHAALPFEVPVIAVAHSCVLTWWRAVHGANAPAEWNEYRRPDLDRLKRLMRGHVIFDGRNVLNPVDTKAAGFAYYGIGRDAC